MLSWLVLFLYRVPCDSEINRAAGQALRHQDSGAESAQFVPKELNWANPAPYMPFVGIAESQSAVEGGRGPSAEKSRIRT